MERHHDVAIRRLRRLARMLVHNVDRADVLVTKVAGASPAARPDLRELFASLIEKAREIEHPPAGAGRNHGDVAQAFWLLPLVDREVLALVAVERLPYEDAADILRIALPVLFHRLTQARTALARLVDGERRIDLRVVK